MDVYEWYRQAGIISVGIVDGKPVRADEIKPEVVNLLTKLSTIEVIIRDGVAYLVYRPLADRRDHGIPSGWIPSGFVEFVEAFVFWYKWTHPREPEQKQTLLL